MKANELRIGNWVEIIQPKNGIYTTVEQSTFSTNIEDSFKPIILTEEWLLNFGFIKKDHVHIMYYYADTQSQWKIKFKNGVFTRDKTTISYIHQLQNLYFSLTGKELTIKQS